MELVRYPPMDSTHPSRLLLPIRAWDHAHGPEDAPYTLVEYGDYECPDCGRLYATLRDLQKEIASRLRVVFRHYPLSGIHHHAQQAAEAAEAAGAQGKFWEMHSLLFERQEALRTNDLIRHASVAMRCGTGLDESKKPRESLEYIVVHEMAHLLEPTHNSRFIAQMDRFLPQWREGRAAVHRLP